MIFLKAISNCHYHKFMFKLSKKQSKVRNIIIDVLSRSPKTDHGTKWSINLLQIYLGITLESSSGVCLKTFIFCSTASRSLRVSTKEAFDLNALTMAFCINAGSIPINFRSFMRIRLSSSSAPIKSASSSPFVSSPHLLSNFEVTVQKSLLRHFLD